MKNIQHSPQRLADHCDQGPAGLEIVLEIESERQRVHLLSMKEMLTQGLLLCSNFEDLVGEPKMDDLMRGFVGGYVAGLISRPRRRC